MAHIDCSFYSQALLKNVRVIVFLPSVSPDDYLEDRPMPYLDPETRWPVLYLLHGSYGDCLDWSLKSGIEMYAQEKHTAVVMPSAENSFYVNMDHGENYLRYVGEELPEFMRRMFPLSRAREDTWIAGLSMGGYGAFRVALEYPETFGKAASLSGVLDLSAFVNGTEAHIVKMPLAYRRAVFADFDAVEGSGNDLPVLLKKRLDEGASLPELFMTVGEEDPFLQDNEKFYAAARETGVFPVYERHPGSHSWPFWDAHIQDVLDWMKEGS